MVVGRLLKGSLDPWVVVYGRVFFIRMNLIQVLYEWLGDDPPYVVRTIIYSAITHDRKPIPRARDLDKTNRR